MTAHKRTEITIETDRTLIIRRGRAIRGWCPECGSEVEVVGPAEAEAIARMNGSALGDGSHVSRWHISKGPNGMALVCLESLLKSK
ncbi:MAG: hypothetical protein LAO24_13690 [Acidobacteriia bacterium]|nr:hypothetical protein [Terriglobia bacterium]